MDERKFKNKNLYTTHPQIKSFSLFYPCGSTLPSYFVCKHSDQKLCLNIPCLLIQSEPAQTQREKVDVETDIQN